MPIERREIRFREDELISAVATYGRQTPGVLPDGTLQLVTVSAREDGTPAVLASVQLAGDDAAETIDVRISNESALELMILYCQQDGIPMPRGGGKHARVLDGLLALVIVHGGA